MTDHLPECESDEFESWQIEGCICDRLRACEQRVLNAAEAAVAGVIAYHFDGRANDEQIYMTTVFDATDKALSAIRALKEKP